MEEFKQYYKFPLKMWEFMDIYILNDHFFIATDPESFLKDPAVSKYLYEGISIAKVMFNENGVSLQNFKHVANYKNGKWIFIE